MQCSLLLQSTRAHRRAVKVSSHDTMDHCRWGFDDCPFAHLLPAYEEEDQKAGRRTEGTYCRGRFVDCSLPPASGLAIEFAVVKLSVMEGFDQAAPQVDLQHEQDLAGALQSSKFLSILAGLAVLLFVLGMCRSQIATDIVCVLRIL